MRLGRALLLACLPLLLPLLAAATTGCKEYKYFDVHVTFDQASFSSVEISRVHDCRVTVSGADSDTFVMRNGKNGDTCPNHSGVGSVNDGGTFEFSSFADSGTMTFTVEVFEGLGGKPMCKMGQGMTSIPVTGMMTLTGEVSIVNTADGCPNGGGGINPDSGT